jgi:hypothetical protein
MDAITLPYRERLRSVLLTCLVLGFVAFVLGRAAYSGAESVTLLDVIYFDATGASVYYWTLFALISTALVGVVSKAIYSYVYPRRLVLTPTEISVPKHYFSWRPTVVPISEVKSWKVTTIRRERLLDIKHGRGRVNIFESELPNASDFDAVVSAIGRHVILATQA